MMVLLVDSACPLAFGYRGVEKESLFPHSLHKSWKSNEMNWDPLSVTISLGTHVFLKENFDFSVADLMVCLSFHPLSEVVCDYEHVHILPGCCRKLPHNVHPLFHERPWRQDGFKLLWGEMRYLGEALVAVATFDMISRFQAHCWPVVAYYEGSVSKAASTRVVSTLTLV